jgi:hypothetical protein
MFTSRSPFLHLVFWGETNLALPVLIFTQLLISSAVTAAIRVCGPKQEIRVIAIEIMKILALAIEMKLLNPLIIFEIALNIATFPREIPGFVGIT